MSKKTYIKTCAHCGVSYETAIHQSRMCSAACAATKRAADTKRHKADTYARHRDRLCAVQREYRAAAPSAVKAEAKRWKPILDEVELKPDNLFLIQALVDELTSDRDLAWLLDWYWLSDATEYLEQQGYEHE